MRKTEHLSSIIMKKEKDMKLIHITMLLLLITVPGLAREIEDFMPDRTVVYKKVGPSELKIHVFTPPNHALFRYHRQE